MSASALGPWHVRPYDRQMLRAGAPCRMLDVEGCAVADVYGATVDEQIANAYRIAAAPELYTALLALADDYEQLMGDGMTKENAPAVLKAAWAALDKAIGKEPTG